MSREDDKRRKALEWADESASAWKHGSYLVIKVPGMTHLYRVINPDGSPPPGALSGSYTTRPLAFAAIDGLEKTSANAPSSQTETPGAAMVRTDADAE